MSNVKKTPLELRAMAAELIEKAKALTTKADQLDQQEELDLLKAIKKAGKMDAVKMLLTNLVSEPSAPRSVPSAVNSSTKPSVQLDDLMTASFSDIQ